ncbi:MAG: amidohydrolase [Candidatus Riflebacteria bacterium]|nr:amidohydrolase [Candidatus Riflebacteria bacterium]
MDEKNSSELCLYNSVLLNPDCTTYQNGGVLVRGDRILLVSTSEKVIEESSKGATKIDLNGAFLIPGFHDSHLHPVIGGIDLTECSLYNLDCSEKYLEKLFEYSLEKPELSVIKGSGWIYGAFSNLGPRKEFLDKISFEKPIFLKAADGHSAWVNSRALDIAGINRHTADPVGGKIERDPETGDPTGTLREWPAMNLVKDQFPSESREERALAVRAFQREAARCGITSIHDAQCKPKFMDVYSELENNGELTLRVNASFGVYQREGKEALNVVKARRDQCKHRLIRGNCAKLFIDGVIDGRTAFLSEPYNNSDNRSRGICQWDWAPLKEMVFSLDREGFQLHFHAVGDAGISMAIDAIEHAIINNPDRERRHQIVHLDCLAEKDLFRMAKLGIVANVQPAWFCRDSNFEKDILTALGSERAFSLYRFRDLKNAGVKVACSSDWPFGGDSVSLNPLVAIQTGITRQPPGKINCISYLPGQAASLAEMLEGFTEGSAFIDFQENITGSIFPGKKADLVALNRNPFLENPFEIAKIKVILTVFDGKILFREI